ncbi:MAG: hypothetical protein ACI4AQ_05870 [Lachnospiraceae bacterium]
MSNQTKIIVLKQKNLIYGFLITAVVILLVSILLLMSNKKQTTPTEQYDSHFNYTAGIYSSTVVLNGNPVELQVTMDENLIHHINAVNISETMETSYPLFNSCLEDISCQVIANNSTENVTYSDDNKYTSMVLINAINSAIEKSISSSK